MKLLCLLLFILLACACSQNTTETDQNEIKLLVERAEACIHFSGEINGDQSDRDKEVMAKMNQLKCADIDQELLVAKHKYKNNPELLAQINQVAVQF